MDQLIVSETLDHLAIIITIVINDPVVVASDDSVEFFASIILLPGPLSELSCFEICVRFRASIL